MVTRASLITPVGKTHTPNKVLTLSVTKDYKLDNLNNY